METVKRTKVVDLLKSTAYGSIVNVKGWVRTHRSSKAVDFVALNDGSTINNVQIVVDPSKVDENQLRQITLRLISLLIYSKRRSVPPCASKLKII